MTFYVENETNVCFPFDPKEIVAKVAEDILEEEQCPYEVQVNVLLTDDEGIRHYNKTYRNLDKPTDVLSFPNLDFDRPADFDKVSDHEADYFDPESGELLLGDIIISVDRVENQAKEYGHSSLREFAFLTAHSVLHLCGYDHMAAEEAAVMEQKQDAALKRLGITRDM